MELQKKFTIFLIVSFKLLLYIVNCTISNSSLLIYGYLLLIVLLSLKYILKIRFDRNSFIRFLILFVISFVIFILYKEDNIFLYLILGLILIDEDNDEIVRVIFYSLVGVFILTLLLGMINILPVSEAYRTIDGEAQIRNSLGFANANAVFAYYIPIILSGIYLFKDNKLFNIIGIICAVILYSFTKCRTGFYLVIVTIVINLIVSHKDNLKLNKNGFVICLIVSLLLSLLFGTTKYNKINELLSYRPWYGYQFLKSGISSWGMGVRNNLILDNLYFKLLANYSIFGIFLYLYIYSKGKNLNKDNKYLLFAMIIFNIYNIFEAMTIGNFVLIIFLKDIFKSLGVTYEED